MKILYFVAAIVLFQTAFLFSEVKLPPLFTSHMVLQQEKDISVWGWADAKEKVTVEFNGQIVTAVADEKEKWKIFLKSVKAGGPYTMKVNDKVIEDILVGEVWLASGQSNMTMRLKETSNAKEEIKQASFPNIRMFYLNDVSSNVPREKAPGKWEVCSPSNAGSFYGTAYYFAKELHKSLNIPVGIIEAGVSGSRCENWIDRKTLLTDPLLEDVNYGESEENEKALKYCEWVRTTKPEFAEWYEGVKKAKAAKDNFPPLPLFSGDKLGDGEDRFPSCFYNALIYPIMAYTIKGVIWYQGEGNCGDQLYRYLFEAMINSWRKNFEQGDFPFIFVQIANLGKKGAEPEMGCRGDTRNEQRYMLKMKNTAMAVAIDLGEEQPHYGNKKDLGIRLNLAALGTVYGKKLEYSGPLYESMKIEGNAIRLKFTHTGTGLMAKDGVLKGFAIGGKDGKFIWGDAKIDGETVVVTGQGIDQPANIRYGMESNPTCTLYNKEGLPASAFTTVPID